MIGVPCAKLLEIEKRGNPTTQDRETFRVCYRLVREYASQNSFVYGGSTLALALRTLAVLNFRFPKDFLVERRMVFLAETALPLAFAMGMDTTSLCWAWTFVATMWPRKQSCRLVQYLCQAVQWIPMQSIYVDHLVTLLESMGKIGPSWPSSFLDMVEQLCVLRFAKMDNGAFSLTVQYVGEIVATASWDARLVAFFIVSKESVKRVPTMAWKDMHRMVVGVHHMQHLVTKWDLFSMFTMVEKRMAKLEDDGVGKDKAAIDNIVGIMRSSAFKW